MNTQYIFLKRFSLVFTVSLAAIFFVVPQKSLAATKLQAFPRDARGRILIQVDSFHRAWYVYPKNGQRYYLKNGSEVISVGGSLAVGISNADLAKIPVVGQGNATPLSNRLKGYFLLAVESRGELWYVGLNGQRQALRTSAAAHNFMQSAGLAAKNADLAKVPMNTTQLMFDPTFRGVTAAKLENGKLTSGKHANTIMPLASLTKLMTAIVLLDTNPNWDKKVVITDSVIQYPRQLVGNDATSEVDLKVGDSVRVDDLWVSLLVASSNQSAVALVDQSGYTRAEFIALMNAKAKELGLNSTYFYDVAGLDSHNVSTAEEMAQLAEFAFAIPKIGATTAILNKVFTVTAKDGKTRNVTVVDRNYSLRAFGVEAAKTGYLTEAQRNAVIKKDGAIIVILHASSMAERNNTIRSLIAA